MIGSPYERSSMDKYLVAIGGDAFTVNSTDHQGAKYDAAVQFRKRYSLNVPLGPIVAHAKSRMIPRVPETSETTDEVLTALKLEESLQK